MKKIQFKFVTLFIYIVSLFFTAGDYAIINLSGFNLQIHHLVFVAMAILTLFKKKGNIKIPCCYLALFFVYLVISSLINGAIRGFNSLLLNAIYAYAIIIVIFNLFLDEDLEKIKNIFAFAIILMYILIMVKDIIQYRVFIDFIKHPWGHPVINVFVGGGVNLEATYLTIFSVFLLEKKHGIVFCFVALIVSILYASRTAIVCGVVLLLYYFIIIKKINVKNIVIAVLVFSALVLISLQTSSGQYIIERFVNTGDEAGSLGRIRIWQGVYEVFINNPLGVGCGNSVKAISNSTGLIIYESNLHNIIFQFLVDEGIIGLIFIISGYIWVIRNEFNNKFKNIFGVAVLFYLLQGLFQSRGVDPIIGLFLGFYYISLNKAKKNANQKNGYTFSNRLHNKTSESYINLQKNEDK